MQWAFAGKYLGKKISELPTSYLEFVEKNYPASGWYTTKCQRESRQEASNELQRRKAKVEKKTIYKKLLEAQKQVTNVSKNGYNDFNRYTYATESDILAAVKAAANDNDLVLITSTESALNTFENSKKEIIKTAHVVLTYKIIDAESGEMITGRFDGYAEDKGDKAVYKAITGANKYFLMKVFGVSTGDDPEKEDEASRPPVTPSVTPIKSEPSGEYEAVLHTIQTFVTDNKLTNAAVSVVTKGKKLDSLSLDELVEAGKQLVDKYGKKAS